MSKYPFDIEDVPESGWFIVVKEVGKRNFQFWLFASRTLMETKDGFIAYRWAFDGGVRARNRRVDHLIRQAENA